MRLALWAALLVACGDSHPGGADAGGDALVDADPDVRGPVSVRIVDKNDAPLAGFYVVFIDRDGTVTEATTDTTGMAQADVLAGASVTAVRARGASYALATVLALVPGDAVTLISAAADVSSSEDPFSGRVVPPPGADIAASPAGATKSGSTATFTTMAPHGLVAGDRVIVANVGVAGYNGSWTVASVPGPTTFTANLGGGALGPSGTVATGGATATKAIAVTASYAAYPGTDHYEVHTRCGTVDVGTSLAPALVLPAHCVATPTDVEVLARTSAGGLLAWTARSDVTITPGAVIAIGDTWHAPAPLTATYANPTAQVTQLAAARFSPYVRGAPIAETAAAADATTMLAIDVSQPARAAMATLLACPSGSSSGCLSTPMGAASQRITHAVDGTAGTYALDIGANLLPWVRAQYVPRTTTLDVEVTGTAPIDLFEANLRYTRDQRIYTWRVFGPVAGSVTFPALPAGAPGDPTLLPGDVMSSYQAFVGESDALGGYRDAVANPFAALGTCEASASPNARGGAGMTNRISQWN